MTSVRPTTPATFVRVAGGVEQAKFVLAAVKVFNRATSLGGTESLIEHRSSMEGPSSPGTSDWKTAIAAAMPEANRMQPPPSSITSMRSAYS